MPNPLNIPNISSNIPRLGNSFSQWFGETTLKLLGWRFAGEFSASKKMVIAVAPHTSNWDFVIGIAVVFALRLKISFFGKHSIFIPPFRALLVRWGGIPIERSKSHGVVTHMIEEVKNADKMLLCVAPEGTRSRIFPWKTGFLHIAQQAEIPVFLIGLDYKHKVIQFGPVLNSSEDIHKNMQNAYDFFSTVNAKYPEKVVFPEEDLSEK
jgi:1-acyl-sn-glycerol-3-phosphate acyltransferase